MLSIVKKRQELLLYFKDKAPFFGSTFNKAFLLALLLHFFAFLIFRIHTYLHEDILKKDPTSIYIDFPENKIAFETQNEIKTPFSPKISSPQITSLPIRVISESHFDLFEEKEFNKDPFQLLVGEDGFNLSPSFKENGFFIEATGHLKNRPFTYTNRHPLPTSLFLKYHVEVENKTGKIFWYELIEGVKNNFGDDIIKSIRFTPSNIPFTTNGNIEIKISS